LEESLEACLYSAAFARARGSARSTSAIACPAVGPEMATQRFEKIESAPGNGMGSEASNLQHLVRGRAADCALRPTNRESDEVAEKGA
jgi:hypothetical protein